MRCRVEKSCCGCDLRRGTLVIGSLSLVGAVAGTFISSTSELVAGASFTLYNGTGAQVGDASFYYTAGTKGFGVIFVVASALLLWGAYKRKPDLLLPWIVVEILFAVVTLVITGVIFVIRGTVVIIARPTSHGSGVRPWLSGVKLIGPGVVVLAVACFCCYLAVVVASYRKALLEEQCARDGGGGGGHVEDGTRMRS